MTLDAARPAGPQPRQGGVVAVLTAAGSGTRLGSALPKALVPVGGRSIVAWAAQGLLASGVVDLVVVTAPPEHLGAFRAVLAAIEPAGHVGSARSTGSAGSADGADCSGSPDAAVNADIAGPAEVSGPAQEPGLAEAPGAVQAPDRPGRVRVVAGSPVSRQASVALGIEAALAACPHAEVVLVHDAARPFTPAAVVRRVVEAVRAGHGAVVPAVPVTDTIKQVLTPGGTDQAVAPGGGQPTPNGMTQVTAGPQASVGAPAEPSVEQVACTVERAWLRAVQTPQGFRTQVLVDAHRRGAERAVAENLAATDDAGLVEAAGGQVVLVAGDPLAFKITRPLDLALAQTLVSRQAG